MWNSLPAFRRYYRGLSQSDLLFDVLLLCLALFHHKIQLFLKCCCVLPWILSCPVLLLHKGVSFCAFDFFPSGRLLPLSLYIHKAQVRRIPYFPCLDKSQGLCPWSLGVGFSQHPCFSGSGMQAGFLLLPQVALARVTHFGQSPGHKCCLLLQSDGRISPLLDKEPRMGGGSPIPLSAVDSICLLSVKGLRQMGLLSHTHQ